MKRLLFLIPVFGLVVILYSCGRPESPVNSGSLGFSADTVLFDSIFTSFQTPSERLKVYNREGRAVNVSRIWLEVGDTNEFSLIIDGIEENDVSDVTIASGDSITIFVSLISELKDLAAEGFISFQVGDQIQRVNLYAFIQDAYFFQARLFEDSLGNIKVRGFSFQSDSVLPTDKPIIMDGPIIVAPGVTVTILPGTEVHFTPYKYGLKDGTGAVTFILFSTLIVEGTLIAEGMPGATISFQGSRLDERYQENPAQWRGIRFTPSSQNNRFVHCLIKNGLIGIQVDSISSGPNPKVFIQHTEIKNMGVYGIYGLGFDASGTLPSTQPAVFMENSIVNTCKDQTLKIAGGGKYAFYNCTFANYNLSGFSRRNPQISIGHYRILENQAFIFPSYTQFSNCIIYGSEKEEILLDTIPGESLTQLDFNYCLVRIGDELGPGVRPYLRNSLENLDPQFHDYFAWDYRPDETSPVREAGTIGPPVSDGSTMYYVDFRDDAAFMRTDSFDIGAYEYYLIEE